MTLLQQTFICPAVTPEEICILGDEITSGHQIKLICLQILIPVNDPGKWLELWDSVLLNKEEFGLASQSWAYIKSKKTPDAVQMHTDAARVCTQ